MKKCTKCGIENADDAKFCKDCGEKFTNNSPAPVENTVVLNQSPSEIFIIDNLFKILRPLGKGGMGEVLLAEDVKLKRKIAIKTISIKDNMSDTSSKIRFLREAQTASQLDHANICTIYEIYEEADKDYIVMQFIDGVTLDQLIGVKKLNIDKIMDIAGQFCSGMQEAHAHDIIHRDIKPGNIMIDRKGVVKILDFGLAKFNRDSLVGDDRTATANLTQKGFVMGTLAYISPEQARGKNLDRRTDIFSFGVVLYELVEGKNPFKKDDQLETLFSVLNQDVEFSADVPEQLQKIIRKALEKDREQRYSNFAALKSDLEAFHAYYTQWKAKQKNASLAKAETEVISIDDTQVPADRTRPLSSMSEKENLGDIVSRVKRFKASTERVASFLPHNRYFKYFPIVALVVLAVILSIYFLGKNEPIKPIKNDKKTTSQQTEKFDSATYIFLYQFKLENTNEQKLPEMIGYLLKNSINQYDELKIIDRLEIVSNADPTTDEQIITRLKKQFNLKFILTGTIKKEANDSYTIDARLDRIDAAGAESKSITSTGKTKDSFLKKQVDYLARGIYGIYREFFPDAAGSNHNTIKSTPVAFGDKWANFEYFYKGLDYYNRFETDAAGELFSKSANLLIVKYYRADMAYFNDDGVAALSFINELKPDVKKMPDWLAYRVLALEARLTINFKNELENLEKVKEAQPFSKDAWYLLGEAYFHHAQPEAAIENYNFALQLDPNYSKALNHIGYCYSYLGRHTEAIGKLQKYRDLDDSTNSFDSLGDGLFYQGEYAMAEEMKLGAAEPGKGNASLSWAYKTLLDIYILKNDFNKAVATLEKYAKIDNSTRNQAYIFFIEALMNYKNHNYPRALEFVEQSIKIFDSDDIFTNTAETHWLRGLILLADEKLDECKGERKWLERFINKYHLSPENFKPPLKFYYHLDALILEKENHIDAATKKFQALLKMKASLSYWITYYNYQFFHTEYASFLNRNQQFAPALQEIEKCLEFNGNYIPALTQKVGILKNLKRYSDAEKVQQEIAGI